LSLSGIEPRLLSHPACSLVIMQAEYGWFGALNSNTFNKFRYVTKKLSFKISIFTLLCHSVLQTCRTSFGSMGGTVARDAYTKFCWCKFGNTKSGVTIFMGDINFHYWRGI